MNAHDGRQPIRITVFSAIALIAALAKSDAALPRIYVYARRDTAARSWLPIACINVVVAEIKQGTFFAINVEPGRYTLLVENGVPLPIDARSGEEYFARLDWHYGLDRPPIPLLAKVDRNAAQKEMKYLSYVAAKRVHSGQVPRSDPRELYQPQLLRR